MSKHAPGPWELRRSKRSKQNNYWFIDYEEGGEGFTLTELLDCNEANARLIAAAPLLLEACQEIVNRWSKGDLAEAVRHCAAVIAVAKGEDCE